MNATAEMPKRAREKESGPVLQIEDVQLSFGDKKVLSGVGFGVDAGERLAVLGASGSGKSTILRIVLGVLRPKAGRVKFKGDDLLQMRRPQLNRARQKIGMVYQYSALLSSLSVRENLALPLEELTDRSREEIDRVVEEKLGLVDMAEAIDKMPGELSGGMKKRIAFARALVLEPELILYDEPGAGLDPVLGTVIDELIVSLSEKTGAASVIVTHEMESAFKIATRMAMLHEGRIIADDTPDAFRESDDPVVAQFIAGSTEGPLLKSSASPKADAKPKQKKKEKKTDGQKTAK
jgi:phospholipid/cholesterol/gamma-HCH transport system ATP-binding protein